MVRIAARWSLQAPIPLWTGGYRASRDPKQQEKAYGAVRWQDLTWGCISTAAELNGQKLPSAGIETVNTDPLKLLLYLHSVWPIGDAGEPLRRSSTALA